MLDKLSKKWLLEKHSFYGHLLLFLTSSYIAATLFVFYSVVLSHGATLYGPGTLPLVPPGAMPLSAILAQTRPHVTSLALWSVTGVVSLVLWVLLRETNDTATDN